MRSAVIRDLLLILTTHAITGKNPEATRQAANVAFEMYPDLMSVDPELGYEDPTPVMEAYLVAAKTDPEFSAWCDAQKTHSWQTIGEEVICTKCDHKSTAGTADRTPKPCPQQKAA